MRLLVTGSSGLIGSEVACYFAALGWEVHGVDNNMRADFFGPQGDTLWNLQRLQAELPSYQHHELDVRDRESIIHCVKKVRPDLVVHAAGQPSHDLAASRPFDDFDTNAGGTLNMLEAVRQHTPEAIFIHMSTNKVYGDRPNHIQMKELDTRWDYADAAYEHGISEDFSIDQSLHSLFGASKLAADVMVQEYGRYFGLRCCALRAGCVTGPRHSGVELHGFLSYLVSCNVSERPYQVHGYLGKQVRDNIHSHDVAAFMHAFFLQPRCGEVYNLGGGRSNSISILEAFAKIEAISGKKMRWELHPQHRKGDHLCYISDLRKMKAHYPTWDVTRSLDHIFIELHQAMKTR
jgi:CDP-paratose 2-epimerase